MQVQSAKKIMEKIFWLFLFVNPFLDILNGFYINVIMNVNILDVEFASTLGVTPTLVFRMGMLLVFAFYILLERDFRSIITAIPIFLAWIFSMLSEKHYLGTAVIFTDAQYTARFCYNIVLLMVYSRVFSNRWDEDGTKLKEQLERIIIFSLFVFSISILFSYVLGVGYNTYADKLGYRGSRGFFYAGNDITAILLLLLPTAISRVMTLDIAENNFKKFVFPVAAIASTANALLLIGSKTSFLTVGISFALTLFIALAYLIRIDNRQYIKRWLLCLGGTIAVFLLLALCSGNAIVSTITGSLSATGDIVEEGGVQLALFSGRQFKFTSHLKLFKAGGPLVWLFGFGRGSQESILEMDLFEVLFYYGIFGVGSMLWLYVKLCIDFLKRFFRCVSPNTICAFASLGLCVGYLTMAGHVLFSVTSGFYLSFIILYSRVCFAQQSSDILLWNK